MKKSPSSRSFSRDRRSRRSRSRPCRRAPTSTTEFATIRSEGGHEEDVQVEVCVDPCADTLSILVMTTQGKGWVQSVVTVPKHWDQLRMVQPQVQQGPPVSLEQHRQGSNLVRTSTRSRRSFAVKRSSTLIPEVGEFGSPLQPIYMDDEDDVRVKVPSDSTRRSLDWWDDSDSACDLWDGRQIDLSGRRADALRSLSPIQKHRSSAFEDRRYSARTRSRDRSQSIHRQGHFQQRDRSHSIRRRMQPEQAMVETPKLRVRRPLRSRSFARHVIKSVSSQTTCESSTSQSSPSISRSWSNVVPPGVAESSPKNPTRWRRPSKPNTTQMQMPTPFAQRVSSRLFQPTWGHSSRCDIAPNAEVTL